MRLHYTTLINIQKTCRISSADFLICFSIQFSQYSPASLMTTAPFEQIPSYLPAFGQQRFQFFYPVLDLVCTVLGVVCTVLGVVYSVLSGNCPIAFSFGVFSLFFPSFFSSCFILIISRSNTLPPMILPIPSFTLLETCHLCSFLISIREPSGT